MVIQVGECITNRLAKVTPLLPPTSPPTMFPVGLIHFVPYFSSPISPSLPKEIEPATPKDSDSIVGTQP